MYNFNNGKIVTTQIYTATAPAGIANFAPVIQNRLNSMAIPFTITYDAVTNVFMFYNSTNNGTLVIGNPSFHHWV